MHYNKIAYKNKFLNIIIISANKIEDKGLEELSISLSQMKEIKKL